MPSDLHAVGVEQMLAEHHGELIEHGQGIGVGGGGAVGDLVGELVTGDGACGHHLGVPAAVVGAQGHGDLCGFEFDAHRAVFG